MPDEAVITIRFKDESSPGGSGVATTSPVGGGSNPGSVTAADQQSAITQAGGVGAFTAKSSTASQGGMPGPVFAPMPPAQALPMPPVGALGQQVGDPLLKTAAGIVQADPSVTVAELQKVLGIQAARAQQLLNAATVQPGGVTGPAPTAALPMPPAAGLPVPPVNPQSPPPAPGQPPTFIQPPPVVGSPESRVTPPPVVNPPQQPESQSAAGVQSAVNAIAGLAARGGPIGAAAGQAASAAVAIPGVASSLGALATAGPILAATGAALAVPATGMLVLNSIAQTARGQIQGLSPEVAAAEAEANVRRLMANLRTAQVLGDEVADRVRQDSRISSAVQGLRDRAVEPLLKTLNDNIAILAAVTEKANDFAQKNPAIVGGGVKAIALGILNGLFPGMQPGTLADVVSMLRTWLAKQEQGVGDLNPLTYFDQMQHPKLPPPFTETDREPAGGRNTWEELPFGHANRPGLSI